jgi:hypothetical protein
MVHLLPATVWPIVLLLACLSLEASQLRTGIDDLDEGYFARQALRVLHGQVPYRDFETLYTPGLVYLHAGIFALLGSPSLVALRSLAWLARAGTCLLLFVLARPLVRNPWWAAVPGLALLVGLDDAPVRWEPHPSWLSTFCALLAVWCVTHRPRAGWLACAGLCAAGAFALKQNTGVFILAAVLVWCARSRWRVLLAAFGAATLVWLAPLALAVYPNVASMGVIVGAVNGAGLFSAPEPTMLIPLAAIAGGVWLMRRDSHPYLRWYLLAGVALLLTEFPRMDTLHLVWSTPMLLVLGAIALQRLPRAIAVFALFGAGALLWPTLQERVTYVAEPRSAIAGVDAPVQTADDLRATIDDIQQRTRPGEPIFVYPTSPLLYVLADRPNPTRFDHLNPGAATPGQIEQVVADLSGVRVVAVSDFWLNAWGPPGPNATLDAWLAAHFSEVGHHGPYRVLQADL